MNSDFKELLADLEEFQVRYLVVGGYAVIHYTEPRYTKDIDLWIEPELENARRFRLALVKFGAWLEHMSIDAFTEPGNMFQIGLPPNRVDFLTSVSTLSFAECWAARSDVRLAETTVPLIGIDHLLRAKLDAGRDQDLQDARALQKVR